MDKKVVLITGCSSGIGLSLAVRLASDPDKTFKGNQRPPVIFIVLLLSSSVLLAVCEKDFVLHEHYMIL